MPNIAEFYQDNAGTVTVEYDDGATRDFNLAGTLVFDPVGSTPTLDPQSMAALAASGILPAAVALKECYLYEPSNTDGLIYDGDLPASSWRYNHDVTIDFFDGVWFALWNANQAEGETANGQYLLQATSIDFVSWTAPVKVFMSTSTCSNPVADDAQIQQWQPVLIKVGGKLLCAWSETKSTGNKSYVATLAHASGKWALNDISALAPATVDGVTYERIFPTCDPIVLPSGRILVPSVLLSTATDTGANIFTDINPICKLCTALISDDGGVTWYLGGTTGSSAYQYAVWEPTITMQPDGTLRMYARNENRLDSRSNYLLTATSANGGVSWSAMEPYNANAVVSRPYVVNGSSQRGVKVLLQNDYEGTQSFGNDRRSLAAWVGCGANDFMPGIPINADFKTAVPCTYAQGRVVDGKLYVAYTETTNSYYSSRMRTSVINPAPVGGEISVRGSARVNTSPVFNATPNRYKYGGGNTTKFACVVSSSGWTAAALSITLAIDSRKLLLGCVFDNRNGTTSGCIVQIGDGTVGNHAVLLRYLVAGTLNTLDTGVVAPSWGGRYWLSVAVDGAGQSVAATLINSDGTVSTNTVAIPVALSNLAGGTPYLGTSNAGSSLYALLGDVYRIRAYDSVLTPANVRYLYEQDRSLLGLPAWSGTQTAPGSARQFLDCNDINAGTNNTAWISTYAALNARQGDYSHVEFQGVDCLKLTGVASASIAPASEGWHAGQYQFRYCVASGRANDVGVCTIGFADNYIEIYKLQGATSSLVVKRSSSLDPATLLTLASSNANAIKDDVFYGLSIEFSKGHVTIRHQKAAPITLPFNGTPAVFFGRAINYYALTSSPSLDAVYFDLASVYYSEGDQRDNTTKADQRTKAWTPSLLLGGAAVGMTTSQAAGLCVRNGDRVDWSFSMTLTALGSSTGTATIAGLPYKAIGAVGSVNAQGGAANYQLNFAAGVAGPVHSRINGTSMTLAYLSGGTTTDLSNATLTSTSVLRMQGWYLTNDPV